MLSILSHIVGKLVFIMTVLICIIIARSGAPANKDRKKEAKKFWDRESEANSVRRKDISGLDYIRIPVDTLPTDALLAHGQKKLYDALMALSSEKILNLSSYSNTDLKMLYGPANLDELSHCDDNFTVLIRTLHKSGEALSPADDANPQTDTAESAISFLEYSVSIGSDMSNTYELLGNLYLKTGNSDAFESLYQNADKLNSISKPVIINKLNSIKSKWK